MTTSLNRRDGTITVPTSVSQRASQNGDALRAQFSDDSEAETEIMNASQNNTPAKRGPLAKHARKDWGYSPERRGSAHSQLVVGENAAAAHLSEPESMPERKHRLTNSTSASEHTGEVKGVRTGEENSASWSTPAVAKMVVDAKGDRDEGRGQAQRRRSVSQRRKAQARRKSEMSDAAEGNGEGGGSSTVEKANIHDAAPSLVVVTPHLKKDPDLPSPTLTSHPQRNIPLSPSTHRRSSSFHHHSSASSKADFEPRSRTRYSSHDDTFLPPAEIYLVRKKRHSVRSTLSPSLAHTMSTRGEKRDRAGRTPLAQACAENNLEKFNRIFTASTADMEKTDNTGNTPLQIAALDGSVDIVKALIEAGANIHCKNSDKDTPLIDAVENSHLEVIKVLLDAGADPRVTNLNGKQPLELLSEDSEQYEEIKQLLTRAVQTYTGDTNQSNPTAIKSDVVASTANSLLYVQPTLENLRRFATRGDAVGVDHLLQCHVRPDNSCLVAAARGGHEEVLSLLIAFGGRPDPVPTSQDDNTPMLAAIGRGHLKVVELLLRSENFEAARVVPGPRQTRRYPSLARSRKGSNWQEEVRMLAAAIRQQRLAAGVPEPVSDDDGEHWGIPALPAGTTSEDARPASVPGIEEATTTGTVSAVGSDAGSPPVEPKRRRLMTGHERSELRAQEERARQEYLDSMPRTLQRNLGRHIPLTKTRAPEDRWIKTVASFKPIACVELVDIDPSCPPERAGELWMTNLQAVIFLAHYRLDTAAMELGWETRPCPMEHRKQLWSKDCTIMECMAMDAHYWCASNAQIEASGIDWYPNTNPNLRHGQNYTRTNGEAIQKVMALDDSQVYWVPLDTFIAATVAPVMQGRYEKLKITTHAIEIHPSDRNPMNKHFVNGVMTFQTPSRAILQYSSRPASD